MKPNVPVVAAELARRLRTDMMAELTGFRANDAAMGAELLDMIAEQWDCAAANLVEENEKLRFLLRRGSELFEDSTLAEAASADRGDLRISSLSNENDRLRTALTQLHARVEKESTPDECALNNEIWVELRRAVKARQVGSANF